MCFGGPYAVFAASLCLERFPNPPPDDRFSSRVCIPRAFSRQARSSSRRQRLSFSSCYLQEARFVVRVVGAHEAIPEIEVDAVVAVHFFVMHCVVGGGIEEKLQWSLHEPTGVKLVAGVATDVVGKLPHHEDCEGEWMDRN